MKTISHGRLTVSVPNAIAADYHNKISDIPLILDPLAQAYREIEGDAFDVSVHKHYRDERSIVAIVKNSEFQATCYTATAAMDWRALRQQEFEWVEDSTLNILAELFFWQWCLEVFKRSELKIWLDENKLNYTFQMVYDQALMITFSDPGEAVYVRAVWLNEAIGHRH